MPSSSAERYAFEKFLLCSAGFTFCLKFLGSIAYGGLVYVHEGFSFKHLLSTRGFFPTRCFYHKDFIYLFTLFADLRHY